MKKTKLIITGVIAMLAVLFYGISTGHSIPDQATRLKMKLKKPNDKQERMIAYNNWNYAMRNDGSYLYRASQTQFGGEFPRGTNYSCVYASGLYVGGLKAGTGGDPDTINVANVEFESELEPGKVLVGGVKDLKYRGYVTPNTGEDATKTADLLELTAESWQSSEYRVYIIDNNKGGYDWDNWPVYAPRMSDGTPMLLSGASAQTYTVFHDITGNAKPDNNLPSLHAPVFGLEMELESFVFTAGLLSNGIFLKLSITNKSSHDYHGAYIGIWSDPDVGTGSSDDMAGVDTNRGLGIVYSNPAGSDPAKTALGLDFLQGPVVDTSEVDPYWVNKFYRDPSGAYRTILKFNPDNALLNAVALEPHQMRLGATAFVSYPNPNGEPSRLQGDVSRYYYIMGLDGIGNQKPFGRYDETIEGRNAQDQRIIHGVGPFTMKSGATQEIWIGFVGAQGTSNGAGTGTIYNPTPNSAIQRLLAADDAMQVAFDNALAAPVAPIPPVVTATAHDNKIVLTWDNRSEYSFDNFGNLLSVKTPTFNTNWHDYDFEGYRVYRSLTGFDGSWEQLAEFDLINGVTVEHDTLTNGRVEYDVRFGSDNGIQHQYVDTNVINQRLYYYSVTAYDYQPLFRTMSDLAVAGYPRSLENALTGKDNMKLIVPMAPPAGEVYNGLIQGELAKLSGTYSNGYIKTNIIDPSKLSGSKSYRVEFFTLENITVNNRTLQGVTPGTLAFRLIDSASGKPVKFDNYTDDPRTYFDTLPGNGAFKLSEGDSIFDDSYYCTLISYLRIDGTEQPLGASQILPQLNGVELKMISDSVGVKDIYEVGAGGALTSVYYKANPTGKYKVVCFRGGAAVEDSATLYSTARNIMNQPFNNFMNSDYEIRFGTNPADSSVIFLGGTSSNIQSGTFNRSRNRVPFQFWKIGWDGPGGGNDYRLEMKMNGVFPHVVASPIFTMDNLIAGKAKYSERLAFIDSQYVGDSTQANMGAISATRYVFGNIAIENLDTVPAYPAPGTTIRIVSLRPIISGSQFTFRQIGNAPKSKTLAKQVMKDIKVVPNPYYGRVLEYQTTLFDKKVKFTNLPDRCTIRIFNVAGDLLRTIAHNENSYNNRVDKDPLNRTKDISTIDPLLTSTEEWDLRNTKGAFVASGMYIALIDAPGIGQKVVKFAVIQEEMRIDGPDNR